MGLGDGVCGDDDLMCEDMCFPLRQIVNLGMAIKCVSEVWCYKQLFAELLLKEFGLNRN